MVSMLFLGVCALQAAEQVSNEHAENLVLQGIQALNVEKYEEALTFFKQAVQLFEESGHQQDKGRTLPYIGLVYFRQHRYDQALEYYQQALELAKKTYDQAGAMVALSRISEVYRRQGLFIKALESCKNGLDDMSAVEAFNTRQEDVESREIQISEGVLQANIGIIYTELGQYFEAMRAYQQARHIFAEVGIAFWQGEILLSMGILYARLGRLQDALRYAHDALQIFSQNSNRDYEATALSTIGGIYDEQGQEQRFYYLKALAQYTRALDIQEERQDRRAQGLLWNNIGVTYTHLGRDENIPAYHAQASTYYKRSLQLMREVGADVIIAKTLDHLGEVHLHLSTYQDHEQHLKQAQAFFEEALALQQHLHDHANAWMTLAHLGQVYEKQQNVQQALQYYRQALDLMENLVSAAGLQEFKISLSAQAASTYQRAILLLVRSGQIGEAFDMSEHARARAFLDLLGNLRPSAHPGVDQHLLQREQQLQLELAELQQERAALQSRQDSLEKLLTVEQQLQHTRQQYEELLMQIKVTHPEYAALVRVSPFQSELIRQALDSETTLLSYFVTPETTLAFILTRNDVQCVSLPVTQPTLQDEIHTLRQMMVANDEVHPLLEQLYAQLFAPLASYLTTPRLGIIPHDALHYLPFAALRDSNAHPRYLGEKYTLFTLPGGSVLPLIPNKRLQPGKNSLLALANSQFAHKNSLPFTIREVQTLQRYYARYYDTNVYWSDEQFKEATENRFKSLAGQHDIVHLAAHGQLEAEDPLFSSISLTPDKDNDGRVEVHELYDLNLERTKLVMLSACETHLGQRSRGDDIIGLTRAFLYAGASSVIASLWQVDDRATCDLMTHFYLHLAVTRSPAQALRAAQRIIRVRYPHPYYWAGFVLTGLP